MLVRTAPWAAVCLGLSLLFLSAPGCDSGSNLDGQLVLVRPELRDLKLLSLKPDSGPLTGGTLVVIAGEGLDPEMTVTFGGTEGTQLAVGGDSLAALRTPAGADAGAVDVVVTRPDGQTATFSGGFTYEEDVATLLVTEVTPNEGGLSGGMEVVVVGKAFEDGAEVMFGDKKAIGVRVLSQESLVATVPAADAIGFVGVTVRLPDGRSHTLDQAFRYVAETPAGKLDVIGVIPASGPLEGGNVVTVEGRGFVDGAIVKIGGVLCTEVRVLGATAITAVVPAGNGPGLVEVRVENPATEGSLDTTVAWLDEAYRYEPASALAVLSVIPGSGPLEGGNTITIEGRGFEDGATVKLGGIAATDVRVLGDTAITATAPRGNGPGLVDVRVELPSVGGGDPPLRTAVLDDAYRYGDEPGLSVVGVIPGSGPVEGGNTITIEGTGFEEGAAVKVGGVLASEVRVLGSTAITAVAPPGNGPGLVEVRVVLPLPDGASEAPEAGLDNAYRYTTVSTDFAVLSVIPASGPLGGGNSVAIEGRGFGEGATVQIGGKAATNVRVLGATAITADAPAGNGPGLVDVRVVLPAVGGGTAPSATLEEAYRYEGATGLSVIAVIPEEGELAGGNVVAIQGAGFVEGMRAFIGGRACTNVRVLGASGLTCTAPASDTAGMVTVRVEMPEVGGASASLADGYRYLEGPPALLVLRAIPATGPLDGGNTVTLEGAGFRAGAKVYFGGAPGTSVNVLASTALTVTAPSQAASGPVAIRVELPPLAGATTGPAYTLDDAYTYQLGSVTNADLTVASLYPTQDDEDGGALVLLTGTGFDPAMTVKFGSVQSPLVQVLSTRAATALVPAGTAGFVDVTVKAPDGAEVVLTGAFRYLAPGVVDAGQAPALGGVVPSRGPTTGGTLARIVGANFPDDMRVFFGATEASTVSVLGPGLAIAVTPAGTAGATAVKVQDGAGRQSTLAGGFTYAAASATPPAIAATWPGMGPATGGTWVVIDGANLTSGSTVFFGMTPAAEVQFVSGTRLIATAPPGDVGTVSVTVVRQDGETAVATDAFGYFDPNDLPGEPPVIGSVAPPVGAVEGGQAATLVGSGFAAGSRVFFGSAEAVVTDASSTSAWTTRTPAHGVGSVAVTMVTPDGLTHVKRDAFTYTAAPPLIREVAPASGNITGGFEVTINGKNFQPGAVVTLGSQTITTFTASSSTAISFLALPSVQGSVPVVVTNPDGQFDQLPNGFTYLDSSQVADPVVTGVEPAQGAAGGGYLAIVRGQQFVPGATVKFGGNAATSVEWISATMLKALVPAGAANNTVDVTVTNAPGHAGTMTGGFHYAAATVAPLTITAVSPGVGSTDGGTVITISGSGFADGSTVTVGTAPATGVNVVSSTTITAVTPAGNAGLVSVGVRRPDQSAATAFNAFAYVAPGDLARAPRVTAVDPSVGPLTGGSLVLLTGARFDPATRVYFGATEATGVTFVDATQLTVRTPARVTSGTVAVSAVNPDGTVGVLPGGYSYYDASGGTPPQVFFVDPDPSGSTFGDDLRVVRGVDLQAGARAYFCGRPAVTLGLEGTTKLNVATPAVEPGVCEVTVTNPDGLSDTQQEAFEYLAPVPTVDSVLPASGPKAGGIDVIVRGDGFVDGATVRFGLATSQLVTVADRNTLTARLPTNTPGVVDVTVVNPGAGQATGTLTAGFTYVDTVGGTPPTISDVFPSAGPLAGGTPVRVVGTGFEPTSLVIFDGELVAINVVSATEIRFNTPPRSSERTVSMTVLNPSGLGATVAEAFHYTNPNLAAPSISTVSPASGPESGGTTINIIGANYRVQGRWLLGGVTLANVNTLNESLVSVQVPAHAPGMVDLVYVGPDGQVATKLNAYEYKAAPVIASAAPNYGGVGGDTAIELVGSFFTPGMKVYFGGIQGTVSSVASASNAIVRSPSSIVPGFVDVTVRNPDGQQGTLANGFEYLAPPSVTSVWPAQGPNSGGTLAVLTGGGFHRQSRVFFGATEATAVHYTNQGTLLAFAPAATTQTTVDIRVDNPDGATVTLTGGFTYRTPADLGAPPSITGLFPARGPATGGTRVAVDGANLSATGRAFILPSPATVELVSATRAIIVAPAGAPGETDVWWTNPDGWSVRSPETFSWLDPNVLGATPVITDLTPGTGKTAGGTAVVATGTGFQSGAHLRFGLGDGTVSASTNVQVTATTPAHTRGTVDVWLVNPDGTQAKAPSTFRFLAPPTVTGVSPAKGPASGGTTVTLNGRDFLEDPAGALPTVLFCTAWTPPTSDDCAAVPEMDLSVSADARQITVKTPVHLPGLVDVVVQAPDGQVAVVADGYTYSQLPTIVSVTPNGGPTAGGQSITISGTGFQPGLTVRIAGKLCTNVNVSAADTVACLTPANAVGTVDVVLANADGGSVTATGAYTYVSPPVLERVSPSTGAEGEQIETRLEGRNFSPQAAIYFNTTIVPEADILQRSTTVIRLLVPLLSGSVDVTVRNPDGQESRLIDGFTYIPPQQPPSLLYITPRTGSAIGGDTFRLAGANLRDGAIVEFGKDPDWVQAPLDTIEVKNSGTIIVGETPEHAAGIVDVRVRDSFGQYVLTDAFEFVPPPEEVPLGVINISPGRSILAGGDWLTLTGTGFAMNVKVTFKQGTYASPIDGVQVVRYGPTLIQARIPAAPSGAAGPATIIVTNPGTFEHPDPEIVEVTGKFEYINGPLFQRHPGDRLGNERTGDYRPFVIDVNGDGYDDVLVSNSSGDRLLINRGEAQPGWFDEQSFPGGSSTDNVFPYDYDGDGDIDLVRQQSSSLQYCRNNGGGSFASCVNISTLNGGFGKVAMGDLNCDGRPDFFLPTSQTNYKNRIVLNLGNGEFTVSDVMLPDNKEASTSAAIADVDGDGDNDILLGQTSASINRLYLNNCMNLTPTSCQIRPPDSTAFNLNGETYALSNNNYTQPQAEGYCKSFGYDGLARIDTQAEQDALEQSAIGTSYWLALTDPEGDYTFDWTRGSDAGVMDWCSGQPQQSNGYNCGYQYWHSNLASRCLRTYPCDNASYRALCETTRPLCAAEWAFVNVTYGVNQPFPSSSGDTRDVLLTDIDLDGTPDAIVTFYNAPTRVYMNTGGTGIHGELFLESFARWPDDTSARDTDELIAVDIDGDTDTDIVARRSYAEVRLYINDRYTETFKQFNCAPPNDCSCNPCVEACDREIVNGPGAFTNETATRWPTGNGAAWRTDVSSSGNQRPFGIGDMDGDDLPDFYIAGSSRSDRMVMNCGYEEGLPWTDASRVSVGEFRFNTYRALPERSEPMQTALMGDLNNDGYPDIFRCGNNRQPEIWINDTSGKWSDETATRFPSFSITCPPHGAILADLDMDGDLDIVIEGTNTRVQLVNGDGRGGPAGYFTNRTTPNMPNNYFQYTNTVIAADFDDDGDPDWFRAEAYSSGNYSSVFINGGDAFNVGGGYAIDQTNSWLSTSRVSDWRYITSAVVIDINGDRFPDLYVGTSQVNKAWLNVDGQYFVDAQTSGVPPESFIHQSSTGTFWLLADDFDADGDDDIIDITNYSGNHYHVRDGSNGYFDRTDLMPAWDNSVNGTSYGGDTGDIDGDGVPDVYLANSSQDQMLIATQNGFSDFSSLLPWARSHSSYEARLLDVDGDCDLDVYVLNYNDQDRVYINSLYSLANPGPGCAPAVP